MTVNENIKKHIEDCEHRIGNILGFMESNSDSNTSSCEENIFVLKTAIIALEEIQEYRAIGTVEGYERAIQSSIENYNLYREYKAKVQEYEAIGSIDEFKELKDKGVAKKPKMIGYRKDGEPVYECGCCGSTLNVADQPYCMICGCKVDCQ